MTAELRCSVCGRVCLPDPLFTGFDPRYRTGNCDWCHRHRTLVLAETVEEATRGYRQLLETRRAALAERRHQRHQDR